MSGFVTEDQRHTERVQLRLKPEIALVLRRAAVDNGMALSKVVEQAVLLFAETLDPSLRKKRVREQYGSDVKDKTVRRLLGLDPVPNEGGDT